MRSGLVAVLPCVAAFVAPRQPLASFGAPRRRAARSAPRAVAELLSTDTSSLLHSLPTLQLAAIQGVTCMDDAGWWCTAQNAFQGVIVSLHTFIVETVGIKDNAYGLTIILFTAICRTSTFPLTYISYGAAERQKALGPYIAKIKERYGDDSQAVNVATAKLYEMTETNPLAGCLPSIAQIPIFIALYRSLLNLAFTNELNEGFLWLPSLEGPTYDKGRGIGWLSENWVDGVPSLGWHDTIAFLVLPIALIATQSVSMNLLTPKPAADDVSAQRANRVLKYLPLMIGWFSANVPAGLGLYWMTSNVFSVASTSAAKAYLAANPPKLDIELRELGLDDESSGVKLPATLEEALVEAKLNARPSRAPRRPGVQAMTTFAYAAPQVKDEVIA